MAKAKAKKAGKKAGKKAAGKKAAKKAAVDKGEVLVVASKVRHYVRAHDVNMSGDVIEALNCQVQQTARQGRQADRREQTQDPSPPGPLDFCRR